MTNPFKNSHGALLIRELFWEHNFSKGDPTRVLYTTRTEDFVATFEDGTTKNIRSLYRLYLDANDPTEFEFASKYFNSMDHWKRVALCPIVRDLVPQMRKDLELKLRSQAFKRLLDVAGDESHKSYVEANRYINTVKWTDPEERKSSKKGRPLKETNPLGVSTKQADEDFERLITENGLRAN